MTGGPVMAIGAAMAALALPAAAAPAIDLAPFDTPHENRVDLDGDGRYDSYWTTAAADGACSLALFDLESRARRWRTEIPNCAGMPRPPIFHTDSFMGDAGRDFTLVVRQATGARVVLRAGDGASGELRDFALAMDNAASEAILRLNGTAVVDFRIARYPGPALFVRRTGGGADQRGHLFHFPTGSKAAVDVTADREVIDAPRFGGYPFPGIDIALPADGRDPEPAGGRDSEPAGGHDYFTALYNRFNAKRACAGFRAGEAPGQCGVPDGNKPDAAAWNKGNGVFLDKVAVGDIDQDGVDDLLITYLWRSIAYPGRPGGDAALLGAPQYDAYYNPQNDGTGCHSGRHYGLSVLARVAQSPYPATLDIAGTPVGQFADPLQNVSRNIALILTERIAGDSAPRRRLAWNVPMGTSIPGCASASLYGNAIHYPADGLLRDRTGRATHIHVNRWTQATPAGTACKLNDLDCYRGELARQTGYWRWEVRRVRDGTVLHATRNMYVWDTLAIPGSADLWILYSAAADAWDLTGLRDDLTLARLDTATLALSSRQRIPVPAAPWLKTAAWQGVAKAVSSNWPATRQFILPGKAGPGAVVVKTAGGREVYRFDGRTWAPER